MSLSSQEKVEAGILRKVSLQTKRKLRYRGVSVWWDRDLECWVTESIEMRRANKEYGK